MMNIIISHLKTQYLYSLITKILVSAMILFTALSVNGQTPIITFESLRMDDIMFHDWGTEYKENGFTFTATPNQYGTAGTFWTTGTQNRFYQGSTGLWNGTVGSSTILTKNDGTAFDLTMVNLSEQTLGDWPLPMRIEGYKTNGSVTTINLDAKKGVYGYDTFDLANGFLGKNLNGVTKVIFTDISGAGSGGIPMDDLVFGCDGVPQIFAVNSELSVNPDWAGGGLRIFPDKLYPQDSLNRRTVEVRVCNSSPNLPQTFYFKVFDVDDPLYVAAPVDPNGNQGDDNRGQMNQISGSDSSTPIAHFLYNALL